MLVGADWSSVNTDGYFATESRFQLETADGANIYVQSSGQTTSSDSIHLHASFETGSDTYAWLNNVVAVGALHVLPFGYNIEMWQLTAS